MPNRWHTVFAIIGRPGDRALATKGLTQPSIDYYVDGGWHVARLEPATAVRIEKLTNSTLKAGLMGETDYIMDTSQKRVLVL